MAVVALNDDQKDQLKSSPKFLRMLRNGAMNKSKFWVITTVPTAVPGGQSDPNLIRWAKSRFLSSQMLANPRVIDGNLDLQILFLKNLTQNVWDNVAVSPFNADAVILNMEANVASMIDAPMDTTFDDLIKYMIF